MESLSYTSETNIICQLYLNFKKAIFTILDIAVRSINFIELWSLCACFYNNQIK